MTTAPALTALALIELIERHIREPGDNDTRTEELRALFADPADDLVHADYAVNVATELATFAIGFALSPARPVDQFIADYRTRLLGRDDDGGEA